MHLLLLIFLRFFFKICIFFFFQTCLFLCLFVSVVQLKLDVHPMLGEKLVYATVSPHVYILSYTQAWCYPPFRQLHSDFGDLKHFETFKYLCRRLIHGLRENLTLDTCRHCVDERSVDEAFDAILDLR